MRKYEDYNLLKLKKDKASQAYRSLSILFYVPATEHKDFDEKHETKCFPQKIDIIHLYMCVCVLFLT